MERLALFAQLQINWWSKKSNQKQTTLVMYLQKKYLFAIVLFNLISLNIIAQNDNSLADSIRITMSTPYDVGVKWNCSCVINNDLVSVTIRESCRKLDIPRGNLVIPDKVIYRYFELSDEQNAFFKGNKPLHLALSELAFDIFEHRDEIKKDTQLVIESDTIWTVSVFKGGEQIDFFSIGNFSRSDNSSQLSQLSDIIEQIVCIGRFSILRQEDGVCFDR